ncbi:MAG: hypothetical protein N3A63_01140 [Bacteroidetes bacterium]|nr:hypothetical protein [Bacteroidota bacterium]
MNSMVIFLLSVIGSLLILLSPFYFKKRHSIQSMSGLSTMLGILGTFGGIFIGLLGFNVHDIARSVPQLLEGLKTAFMTSIAGMVTSLLLKEWPQIYGLKSTPERTRTDSVSAEMFFMLLSKIEGNQREFAHKQHQQLLNIERGLCGEGDTTLLTQIQKLRTTITDKFDELLRSFREFSTTVAENSSKSLIEALTHVVRDFNTKITEQFGDNFKELNEAVGKILEWQRAYAQQVDAMIKQINDTVHAVQQSSQSLERITEMAGSFTTSAKSLESLLVSLETIRDDLQNHLKAFVEMAQAARSAFPVIDEQLRKLMQELVKSVDSAVDDSKKIVALQLETTKQLQGSIHKAQEELNKSFLEMVTKVHGTIEKMVKDNAERIAQQLKILDQQLGDELNKSLRTLGSQLASLSNQFVKDYTPLTEKLKEVVHLATSVRG